MQVLAEGIQGVFEGHSMGIRVSKRAFSEEHSGKVLKTYGFSTCRDPEIDTELPYYNIKGYEKVRIGFKGVQCAMRAQCAVRRSRALSLRCGVSVRCGGAGSMCGAAQSLEFYSAALVQEDRKCCSA